MRAVLAASQPDAERITMSRHETRQRLAHEFGSRTSSLERSADGVARIEELTDGGLGAYSVIEAVGTREPIRQAIESTRPGHHADYVESATTSQ
jgi:threonine dehydrogenase-like Zn-dependent dehydrogenase